MTDTTPPTYVMYRCRSCGFETTVKSTSHAPYGWHKDGAADTWTSDARQRATVNENGVWQ